MNVREAADLRLQEEALQAAGIAPAQQQRPRAQQDPNDLFEQALRSDRALLGGQGVAWRDEAIRGQDDPRVEQAEPREGPNNADRPENQAHRSDLRAERERNQLEIA